MNYIKLISKLSVFIVALLYATSCGDNVQPRFEAFLDAEFEIPAGVLVFTQGTVTAIDIPSNLSSNLTVNGMAEESITSIMPGRAILKSKFNNVDLGFFRDVSVRAVKIDDPNVVKEMFYLTDIRFNEGNSIELFPSLSELKDILTDPLFDIKLVVNYQSTPSGSVPLELDFSYLVFDEE